MSSTFSIFYAKIFFMTINQTILELRKERGLSQKAVADAVGISQSTIAKIEINRNEATASTIRKLADFFGVSSDYLLGRTDDFGAVATPANVPTLTAKEKKLLDNFREMREDLQAYFLEMSETFIQTPEYLIEQGKNKRRKV